MTNEYKREELYNTALSSPAAVTAEDRDAWVSIFSRYAVIEDPVGSSPHVSGIFDPKAGKRGNAAVQRFYDNFIAPSGIEFQVNNDIVIGNCVMRDLTIKLTMSTGLKVDVPMFALYEMTREDGIIKVCRLAAHWELPAMIKQIMSKGFAGIYAMTALGIRMMKYMGISGSLGFSKGFLGIHQKGRDSVTDFIQAVNSKDAASLKKLFARDNKGIEFPAFSKAVTPDSFINSVDANISVSKVMPSGYVTTFAFKMNYNGNDCRGAGLFDFNAKSKKIDRARFFWEG